MNRPHLTLDEAKVLPHEDLIRRTYALLTPYEAGDIETPKERDTRISRSLDQLPDIYAWFNQLHSWFDHWADFYYRQDKASLDYKAMRQKRDLMERAASSVKLRYEGASRRLTQLQEAADEVRMPRGR